MAQRRSDIVDEAHAGVYHCTSRCVRRELILLDPRRRAWIVARLEFLAQHFAIDVVAFCAMANHMHLILATHPEVVASLSDRDVALRMVTLFASHRMHSKRLGWDYETALEHSIAAMLSSNKRIQAARRNLSSLGFFHKLLKEPCAKLWNREDKVTGHCWEGRFKSRAVLDRNATEVVAMYVELNEVHACAATSIPSSTWSSALLQWQRVCETIQSVCEECASVNEDPCERLLALRLEPVFPCRRAEGGGPDASAPPPMFFDGSVDRAPSLLHYIDRLDRAGRRRRPDKAGWIPKSQPDAVSEAIASVLPSLLRGPRRVRRAARSIASWWSELREEFAEPAPADSFDKVARSALGEARGSCYGSKESIAREALRRGQRRMVPVWSSA
jgi:hypothetical protein